MDPLTGLLQGPRAQGAFVLRMVMEPPWAVRIQDRATLTLAAVVAGEAWVTPDNAEPQLLPAGHIGVLRGPDPYVFGDLPATRPQIIVHPGQRCEDLEGRPLQEPFARGVRTWGNDANGGTVVVIGTYEQLGGPGQLLLENLPPILAIDSEQIGGPIVDMITSELTRDVPGQGVVLDRLLDLLAVSVLRYWFDHVRADAPRWWQAMADPVVGAAVRLLQNNPVHSWTVASLASQIGVSRATLARQFTDQVGQSPMAFLTDWRLALAADLLLEPGATVQNVATRVGYGSSFAFSTAFKRVRGISPSEHRGRAPAAA